MKKNIKRRIMAINLNDFGRKDNHLMSHRIFRENDGRYHIDWEWWGKNIDKTHTWNQIKDYITRKDPDILFVQEMLISSYEMIDFIEEFKKIGYSCVEESLPPKGNYSITVAFYKGEIPEYLDSPGGYRINRTVICKYGDLLITGSHFPSESDEKFLEYIKDFVLSNLNKDLLLMGDLNANDPKRGNKMLVNNLLEQGAIDLWIAAGNDEKTPTEARFQGRLDYALASPSMAKRVKSIEIDSFPMDEGITDHAAVIVDII